MVCCSAVHVAGCCVQGTAAHLGAAVSRVRRLQVACLWQHF
jgi:hypothetical protein